MQVTEKGEGDIQDVLVKKKQQTTMESLEQALPRLNRLNT